MGGMTIGEKLLNLTIEYSASVSARSDAWGHAGQGAPEGREPIDIAADYAHGLRELLRG